MATTDLEEDKHKSIRIWLRVILFTSRDFFNSVIINGLIQNNSAKSIKMDKKHEIYRVEQVENQVWNGQFLELHGESRALLLETELLRLHCLNNGHLSCWSNRIFNPDLKNVQNYGLIELS